VKKADYIGEVFP